MGRFDVGNKHIYAAVLFLTVLTAGNYEILFSKNQDQISQTQQIESDQNLRSPASVVEEIKEVTKKHEEQIKSVDIGCEVTFKRTPQSDNPVLFKSRRFSLKDSMLMLKGKSCLQGKGYSLVHVRNLTNGFTASVFQKNKSEFQTDFIQMNQGLNQVVFELENQQGEKFTEILYFELKS